MNKDNLRPEVLLQMDFCFLDETSIRQFTCALVVVDTKMRKIWTFYTPGKRPPLEYNRKYNKWTGALQHIAVWSRQDISHAIMRLSEYNAAPSLPCWKSLDHTMRYLYHKPHVQIMYPRRKVEEKEDSCTSCKRRRRNNRS